MNAKKDPKEIKDAELVGFAKQFLEAFSASATTTPEEAMASGRPYALGAAGIVEITDEVTDAHARFVHRAAKLLKSKAAHEKAIAKIAFDHAHKFVTETNALDTAASDLIRAVFEHGNTTFSYLAPNYLFNFIAPVRQIEIGRVRALVTEDFSTDWQARYPGHRLNIVAGKGFSLHLGQTIWSAP